MCNRKSVFFFLAFFASYIVSAQTSQLKKVLPVFAPASPEAASLGKFGNYEVSLFTGVPNISIPIYEVKIGELSLPISLNYHASGIKVNEMPSRVGLGWSLNSGGIITRSIRGLPDEQPNNYFSASATSVHRVKVGAEIEPNTVAGLDYLSKVDTKKYDVEPDIFSYMLPGQSGRFLFNQKDNFNAYLIPFAPIAVSKTQVNPYLVNFTLTDEGGRKYLYNTTEHTQSGSGLGLNANATSAWLLSQMVSANGQDAIKFNYTPTSTTDQYKNEYFSVNDNVTGAGYYNYDQGAFGGEFVGVSSTTQQLHEISFPGGRVTFEAASESRSDFGVPYTLPKRLKYIKVFAFDNASQTYSLLKTYELFHSYFTGASPNASRLRLDAIQLQTASNAPVQTYSFAYNNSIPLPERLSTKKDLWGYFNNNVNMQPGTSIPTAIPRMQMAYNSNTTTPTTLWIGGSHTDARDVNSAYNQACILQQITFPTGGYTQFTFESNQYLDANNVAKYAGGLRVKTIKSYDGINGPIVKTYKYGAGESGYGRANFVMEQHFFSDRQNYTWVETVQNPDLTCRTPVGRKTTHTFLPNPTNDLEGWDSTLR